MNVKNQSYINGKQRINMLHDRSQEHLRQRHESLVRYIPNPHLFWKYFVIYERDTMIVMQLFFEIYDKKTKEHLEQVACIMKFETNRLKALLSASRAEIVEIQDRIEKLYQHVI